ncbi:MAG: hypothetical protein IT379_19125 [Deltaproteobacteria bacterium]|nr:hypothetical protein [Deltaproteobacteria bacterium]
METRTTTFHALCLSALLCLPLATGCLGDPASGDEADIGVATESISGIIVMIEWTWHDPSARTVDSMVGISVDRAGYDDLVRRGYDLQLVHSYVSQGRRYSARRVVDLASITPEPPSDGTTRLRVSTDDGWMASFESQMPGSLDGSEIQTTVDLVPPPPLPTSSVDANPTPYPMPSPIAI